jgi:hypothetical protein
LATDDLGADRRAHDLESAFRAHRDWLVRRLALIVGDAEEARDLAQEAFVRAAETWPLPDMTEPARWLSMACAWRSMSAGGGADGASSTCARQIPYQVWGFFSTVANPCLCAGPWISAPSKGSQEQFSTTGTASALRPKVSC